MLSKDGAYASFLSASSDLVVEQTDTNNHYDVFVFERATGSITLASHVPSSTVTSGNLASQSQAMSADGAFVVFTSAASGLVSGQTDGNSDSDVYLYERATGSLRLVSRTPAGPTTTGDRVSSGMYKPSISADGSTVAFESRATNLVPGQADANNDIDAFLFDSHSGVVTLLSHTPASSVATGNDASFSTSLSADGAVVAFRSEANNLVAGQTDFANTNDVFVLDRATGVLALMSHTATSATTSVNALTTLPVVSANGAFVAFQSYSSGVVTGQNDTNDRTDVFLYERATAKVTLVSHTPNSATTASAGSSHTPSVSANGSVVVYQSDAANVVQHQSDGNGAYDVFASEAGAGTGKAADFDGNGSTDVGVFRPAGGAWMIQGRLIASFGAPHDLPVAQDYDGNGTTDISVYRPQGNMWFVQGGATANWGTDGDIPVPGDHNGDGAAEFAVFRPRHGLWFVRNGPAVAFGTQGDIPVPDDYDGDGATEMAVFRPDVGVWFFGDGPAATQWGTWGDVPVPGDYNGDGRAEAAVFRPSSGTWFVRNGPVVQFGTLGDVPVPGDYDGDGNTDIAVFRPATGAWYFLEAGSSHFGISGDIPLELPSWIAIFLGLLG